MAINSKEIEILWNRFSDEGVKKGMSVAQYFESNGVPYDHSRNGTRTVFNNPR